MIIETYILFATFFDSIKYILELWYIVQLMNIKMGIDFFYIYVIYE